MPKINRIRIVNFAYNNEIREIPDLTLSFYDGESALINLSNGGGKSVLVELILQAVVPDLMIQKRKMSSFFRRSSRPSYLIIEWKLDREKNPDYLMTGIAMTGGSADDRLNGAISYFTFGSHYERANEFDLAALPLSKIENDSRTFMSFEKARDYVRTQAGKLPEAFYFAKGDVAGYRKKLEEFHIFQDEWRNIIARMNDEEGGIDGLFAKCADSDQLVSQWIVRTVEKSMSSEMGEDMQTSIPDLTLGLVEETRRNREDIQACAELKAFLKEQGPVKEALAGAAGSLEMEEEAGMKVRTLIGLVFREKENLGGKIAESEEEEKTLNRKMRRVDDEEVSGAYLKAAAEKAQAARALHDADEDLAARNEEAQNASHQLAVLDAAEKYGRLQGTLGRIQALTVQKDELEGKGSRGDRLKNLGWTLRRFCEDQETALIREAEETRKAAEAAEDRKAALSEETSTLLDEQFRLERESSRLEVQNGQFEAEEAALEKRAVAAFPRDLFGCLEQKTFDGILSSTKQKEGSAASDLQALQQERGDLEKQLSEMVDQILILSQIRSDQVKELSGAEDGLLDYQKELTRLKDLARLYDYREDSVFQKEAFCAGASREHGLRQSLPAAGFSASPGGTEDPLSDRGRVPGGASFREKTLGPF